MWMMLWLLVSGASAHGIDFDDDAWADEVDCGPLEPETYPGADEVCDYIDNDCDGDVDEEPECRGCTRNSGFTEGLGLTGLVLPVFAWRRRREEGS